MNNAKNLRSLVALGVLAATINATHPGSATAQQRRGGGAPGGFADNPGMALWNALDQRFEDFSERLALSDEQVSRTNTLVADFREEYHGTGSKPSNFMRTQLYLMKWFEEYGGQPRMTTDG